jgi:hypothetical protein
MAKYIIHGLEIVTKEDQHIWEASFMVYRGYGGNETDAIVALLTAVRRDGW